jgi:outer membrane protein assembly factor BamB
MRTAMPIPATPTPWSAPAFRLLVVAVLVLAAALAGGPRGLNAGEPKTTGDSAAAEPEEEEIDPDNLVLIGRNNDEVTEEIEAARGEIAAGRFGRAIEAFQRIIEKSGTKYLGSYMASGKGLDAVYIPAREFCLKAIQNLPIEARNLYNRIYGPKAAGMIEEALSQRDYRLLEQTAENYILTIAGRKAALTLVEILATHGDYYRALYYLDLIESFYPHEDNPGLAARRIVCHLAMGAVNSAEAVLEKARPDMPDAEIIFNGKPGKIVESLALRISSARAGLKLRKENVFNSFYSSVYTHGPTPPIKQMSDWTAKHNKNYWQSDLENRPSVSAPPPIEDPLDFGRRQRRPRGPGHTACRRFPVIAGNRLLFKSAKSIGVIDLSSGKLKWNMSNNEPIPSQETGRHSPFGRRSHSSQAIEPTESSLAMDYQDGVLYVLARKNPARPRILYAVDLTPGGERILWYCNPPATKDLKGLSFASIPLVRGNNVFMTAFITEHGKKETLFYMCSLDRTTGRLRWKTELCAIPSPSRYMAWIKGAGLNFSTMCEADGHLFVVSNIGVISKLSAHTGAVKWIKKYPRPKPKRSRVQFGPHWYRNPSFKWELIPPLYYRADKGDGAVKKALVVAPAETRFCVGIDPDSGRVLYKIDNPAPGNRYIMGPWKGRFFTYGVPAPAGKGEQLLIYDVLTGKIVMEMTIPNDKAVGKALIAGNSLYLPGGKKLYRFDLDDKKITNSKLGDAMPWPYLSDESKPVFGLPFFFGKNILTIGNRWLRFFPPSPDKKF